MKTWLLVVTCGTLALIACDRNRVDTTRTTRGLVPASTSSAYQNYVGDADADAGTADGGTLGGNPNWPTGREGSGTGAAGQPANERR